MCVFLENMRVCFYFQVFFIYLNQFFVKYITFSFQLRTMYLITIHVAICISLCYFCLLCKLMCSSRRFINFHPCDGHPGCLQLPAATHNAVINILANSFYLILWEFLRAYRRKLISHRLCLYLICLSNNRFSPVWLYQCIEFLYHHILSNNWNYPVFLSFLYNNSKWNLFFFNLLQLSLNCTLYILAFCVSLIAKYLFKIIVTFLLGLLTLSCFSETPLYLEIDSLFVLDVTNTLIYSFISLFIFLWYLEQIPLFQFS